MRITKADKSLKFTDTSAGISNRSRIDKYWQENGFEIIANKFTNEKVDIRDVSKSTDFIKSYSFVDIEYGRWVSNEARANYIAAFAVSFIQLDRILKFKKLGLNTISLAIGARGSGGASGHFEPNTFIINITRYPDFGDLNRRSRGMVSPALQNRYTRQELLGGVGSVAHEYGHAIDYFFGLFYNDNALTGGRETHVEFSPGRTGDKLQDAMNKLLSAICYNANGTKNEYYTDLKKSENDYWYRNNEIFARVFEQYISNKLAKAGHYNKFLCDKATNYPRHTVVFTKKEVLMKFKAYLQTAHYTKVEPLMDALINVMRTSIPVIKS